MLAIRPEKIVLLKTAEPGAVNQFNAVIEDLIYSGAETHYFLRVGETRLRSCAFNATAHERSFQKGQTVALQLPAESLVVLND